MKGSVSHDRRQETVEAKARWFQSLPRTARMELLCFYTDLILENNPTIMEKRDAEQASRGVRVLAKP